jgi:DNA-binding protein H-NS
MQDLSKYSISKLRALEAQVDEALKTQHFLAVSRAREQILHIARNAGLSDKQVLAIKSPKAAESGSVKYRNPDDPAQQWSGRGRQPAWIKAWVASGKSIEDAKASS